MQHERHGGWIHVETRPQHGWKQELRDVHELYRKVLCDGRMYFDLDRAVRMFAQSIRRRNLSVPGLEYLMATCAEGNIVATVPEQSRNSLRIAAANQQIDVAHGTLAACIDSARVQRRAFQC